MHKTSSVTKLLSWAGLGYSHVHLFWSCCCITWSLVRPKISLSPPRVPLRFVLEEASWGGSASDQSASLTPPCGRIYNIIHKSHVGTRQDPPGRAGRGRLDCLTLGINEWTNRNMLTINFLPLVSQMRGTTARLPVLPTAAISSAGNKDASCSDSEFTHTPTHKNRLDFHSVMGQRAESSRVDLLNGD